MVGAREVEVDAAERPNAVRLAENHRDLPVEGNPMAQPRSASLKSADGLFDERTEGLLELFRRLFEADGFSRLGFPSLSAFPAQKA